MNDWQTYTMQQTVVGPRLRDRVRVAYQVLRGYNRLRYTATLQLKTEETNVVYLDGMEANLFKGDT